jgi:hypothetical protein
MVQTTLDTATLKSVFDTAFLKAALLQLVQEDPTFLQNLLANLPKGEESVHNVVAESPSPNYDDINSVMEVKAAYAAMVEESPSPNYGGIPNTKLDALIQLNFERYDETFRKLA